MEKYDLNGKDYNLLKRIVVITKSILNSYYLLIDEENDGKKDLDNYNNIISELKINLEMEKELYDQLDSVEKVCKLLDYINDGDDNSFEKFLYSIFDNSPDNLVKNRIASKLEYIIDTKKFSSEDDLEDDSEYIDGNKSDEKEEQFLKLANVQISIENDIVNTTLFLLKDYLDNPYYNSIRYPLIEFKYLLPFVFPNVEDEMLKNNYNFKDKLHWSHKLVADYIGINEFKLKEQVEDYCIDLLDESRDYLISLLNRDYSQIDDIQDSDEFVDGTIFELIGRSCLLFISEELAENYIGVLENDIEEVKNKNMSILPIVKSSVENYHIDREKPLIVSLKRG